MNPHEMTLAQAVERLESLRLESHYASVARQALGNWRRRLAATLVAFARRLEPGVLTNSRQHAV